MDTIFIFIFIAAIAYFLFIRNPKDNQSSIIIDSTEAERAKLSFSNSTLSEENKRALKMIGIPIIIIILIVIGVKNCSNNVTDIKISNKEKAFYMSQHYVKDYLKAPSTAKFPIYPSNDVSIIQNDSLFIITSWVDANNSFNAPLRNKFSIRLIDLGEQWKMEYLFINNEQVYP